MNSTLLLGLVAAAAAGLAFLLLFRHLLRPVSPPRLEWLSEFSVARYRPMMRLLDREDYEFLAGEPGFHPRIARALRARRRKIFRDYLRSLRRDFNRLHCLAKLYLLHAAEDRPDLATDLLKLRWVSWYAIACARARLALEPLGVRPADVRGLLSVLDSLRGRLQAAPVPVRAR